MRFSFPLLLCSLACAQDQTKPNDSVIVTGVYEPVPLEEADRAVRVIPLDANQKLLSNTLFDFLRLDPSLDVQSRAPNGIQTDISIRGGNFGQTLVLLDGVRMNDAQTGHFDLDLPIPANAAGRLEILKGAGSAIYGSDAVGGVINVITSTPESNELHFRTAVGNFGVNQQSADLTFVRSGASEQLYFSRDFSTGFMDDRDYRSLSFASVTRWNGTHVTLAYDDRPYGANQFYGPYSSWERTKSWFAAMRQRIGKSTEASLAFRRHSDLFVLLRNNPEIYTNRHAVEGYQAALRRHTELRPSLTMSYGGEAFRDRIDSNNLADHQRNYGAVYAAVDMRALKRYSFTLGAREEIFHGGARQFNPTAALGAWLTSRWKLRASASRAFRLPSYTDLYYHDPANVGSPFLKPETAWGYDAAVEWNSGGRVKADFGVFATRERNGIDFVRSSENDLWRATNFDRVNFLGADASVSIHASTSQWIELRYTALHGAQDSLGGTESKYVFNYPVQNATAAWNAVLPKGFIVRTRVGVLDRYAHNPYGVWDLYLADRRGSWSPFLQLTNLTSTRYQEIPGVAVPGRAVVAGVDWKLGW
jgi:iron complex outermembrane receptor protein